jgi:hypothetical protein
MPRIRQPGRLKKPGDPPEMSLFRGADVNHGL